MDELIAALKTLNELQGIMLGAWLILVVFIGTSID